MAPVTYEHPLAYLLGIEGIALLRSFTGEGASDREFVEARIAEIRRLLDDESLASAAVEVARVETVEGYRIWSDTYDAPNAAFDFDEPLVKAIVDTLPVGVALDAACGTGRVAASLAARGHHVLGVDSSPTCSRGRASGCRRASSASASCPACRSPTTPWTSSCAPWR